MQALFLPTNSIKLKIYLISNLLSYQINNDFIFKTETIFTFKFNPKLAFMYKYQHESDGPPYISEAC